MLDLLAHELFRRELSIGLSSMDWSAVLDESNRHAVTALLFPGVMRLSDIPDSFMSRICGAAVSASYESERMLQIQREILDLLEQHGLSCAVLKGTSVACLYPHPELRVPGDIDILVSRDKLTTTCKILSEHGFRQTHAVEKHTCLQKLDICVEVHAMVSVFPENEKGIFTRRFMAEALQHTASASIGDSSFPVLTGMYQIIALLAHMDQHLSDSGIGLRQLCDWAVTVDTQRDQIGDKQLVFLDRCGLLPFAKIVTKICEKYLGLPSFSWSEDVDETLVDALMEDIIKGGNFQAHGQQRPFAGVLTDAYNVDEISKTSTMHSYFQYIRTRISYDYPWAKSRLWLAVFGLFFPARWIVRMLLGKRRKFSITQAVQSARQREQLLRKLKLFK